MKMSGRKKNTIILQTKLEKAKTGRRAKYKNGRKKMQGIVQRLKDPY